MTTEAALLEHVQALRVPVGRPGTPDDWKDWYHFVLLDLERGTRVIVNVALIGGETQGEIQTTLIAHLPADGAAAPRAFGSATTREWRSGMVRAEPLEIAAPGVTLTYSRHRFDLALDAGTEGIRLVLEAHPKATPLLVTDGAPFGSGFIGWGLVPGLAVAGELRICEELYAINERWFCYQDHNFGRFRWGEDFGWEWLTAHACSSTGASVTLVVDWRTNRSHSVGTLPYVFVYVDGVLAKVFVGPALRIQWRWSRGARLPLRLPGAMASVHAGETTGEPQRIEIAARDERDRLEASVVVDGFVEIIAPDNRSTRCTRIGEASGSIAVAFTHRDRALEARGWAYGEYTH